MAVAVVMVTVTMVLMRGVIVVAAVRVFLIMPVVVPVPVVVLVGGVVLGRCLSHGVMILDPLAARGSSPHLRPISNLRRGHD